MSRIQIKIYTDEDIASGVAKAIKRRGFEVSTTPEHDNFKLTDEKQLAFATSIEAAILTHNVSSGSDLEMTHKMVSAHWQLAVSLNQRSGSKEAISGQRSAKLKAES